MSPGHDHEVVDHAAFLFFISISMICIFFGFSFFGFHFIHCPSQKRRRSIDDEILARIASFSDVGTYSMSFCATRSSDRMGYHFGGTALA